MYHTIGEVSEMLHLPPHTLRYWERELGVHVQRTRHGTRRYSTREVELLTLARHLLHERGYTFEGVRKFLSHVVVYRTMTGREAYASMLDVFAANKDRRLRITVERA